jgi:hypothetical protein
MKGEGEPNAPWSDISFLPLWERAGGEGARGHGSAIIL